MELLRLDVHDLCLINLVLVVLLVYIAASGSASSLGAAINPPNFPISKPNCPDRCGNVNIPFPFGITEDCSLDHDFYIFCNETLNPPKPFFNDSPIDITSISLAGQLKVSNFIAYDCYDPTDQTGTSGNAPWINLPGLTISNTANKFTIVGCDTYGYVEGLRGRFDREFDTGCSATCGARDDLKEGSCAGLGCCQISIPDHVWQVQLSLYSYNNYSNVSDFNNCGYAFLADEHAFNFSAELLTDLKNVTELPMVVDWAIGKENCTEAQKKPSSFACKSGNSACDEPNNGFGYRCKCTEGYRGNPYLDGGCRDIDECEEAKPCTKRCENTPGSFKCICPKGYRGDGKKDGQGCIRGESLVFRLAAGILLGIIVLLLSACWLYLTLQRRRLIKMRQQYFHQNGGLLLQEKLNKSQRSPDMAKIFSESELQKATNNFHDSMIIGQGGYGTVYKGILDNRIVAIKKSKEVDPNQIDQFTNEVIVLSQINHRNVVKLLGCCLETQIPLLVYEFISSGTLFEHIHNKAKARSLSWDMRLRIATETAGVLSYLHSGASIPIVHRDVKSANILLDHTYTAKVSDFGASRLVPLDQTQLATLVLGTFGYLDPEYMQTQQLTEKSDVYSFGVILVELLTGRKAVSNDGPEEERSLANFFLSVMKDEHSLFQVLEDNVVREVNKEQLMKVAILAKSCLKVKGDDRPSMKEIAMELEGLRAEVKHSWLQTEHTAEDKESLLVKGFSGFVSGESSSTSVGFDSLRNHIILPVSGGR